MTNLEVDNCIFELNSVLNNKPWLDIDVVECSGHSIVLHCGIDLTSNPEIEIKFESIYFVSLLMSWKTDTSHPVVHLLTGEDMLHTNKLYRIEEGHHLFAFFPECLNAHAKNIIAARCISWRKIE